ncbi:MAG: DoxX family protein [Actinomycetota bacterium]
MLVQALQVVIAVAVAIVWLVRPNTPSPFRGGSATTIREEFVVYGLPDWSFGAVRAAKLACAALLVVGLAVPSLTPIGAFGMAAFMVGAVAMHVKVRDPLMKSLPAAALLVLSLYVGMQTL